MVSMQDLRQLQTAVGNSLWGSFKLLDVPLGATQTQPVDLVRVNIPDDKSACFTVALNDDPGNPDTANRKVEIFFGCEGHQVSTGRLDFPRGRLLTFPGSYIRVVAWVEGANPAGTPRPVFKLGAHASLFPARSGSFFIIGAFSVAAGASQDVAIPHFARGVRIEENTATAFHQYRVGLRVQNGATVLEYQTSPAIGIPYQRAFPANAVVLRLYNTSAVASVWTYDFEMDF